MAALKLTKEDAEWLAEKMDSLMYNNIIFTKNSDIKRWKTLADRIKRSTNSIKPRSAKNKGASFQKDMAEFISRVTGVPFDNQSDQSEILCRTMGCSGVDIMLRGEAIKRFKRFAIECKNQNTLSLPDWIRQAKANCNKDGYGDWLLMIKSALIEDTIVVMSLSALEENFDWPFRKTDQDGKR